MDALVVVVEWSGDDEPVLRRAWRQRAREKMEEEAQDTNARFFYELFFFLVLSRLIWLYRPMESAMSILALLVQRIRLGMKVPWQPCTCLQTRQAGTNTKAIIISYHKTQTYNNHK